jgi:hypothetical protein
MSEQEGADEIQTEGTSKTETSGCKGCSECIAILKKNPLYNEASNIFHWRDPVRSGLLFGIGNLFYILLTWGDYSVITLTSYLLLALTLVCLSYTNFVVLKAAWLQGKKVENPFKDRFKDQKFHLTREAIDPHVDTLIELINVTIDEFRDVFYCTDNMLSLRFALYFYIFATIGGWFSALSIFYLALLGFFVWPRLYEEKKKEIDHFYGIAKTEADKYFQLALSKIPPNVTARFPFLKAKSS